MDIYLYKVGKFSGEIEKVCVLGYTEKRILRLPENGEGCGNHAWETKTAKWFETNEEANVFSMSLG
jgi:hypothetical protein